MSMLDNPNEVLQDSQQSKFMETKNETPYGVKVMYNAYETTSNGASTAANFVVNNPGTTGLCVIAGVATGVALAPAAVGGVALSAVGFTSSGVAAGSAAAGWQASIGSVVAPSLFSTLQSAAAGGYGAAAVSSAISTGASMLGVTTAGEAARRAWWGKGKKKEEEDEEEKDEENDGNHEQKEVVAK